MSIRYCNIKNNDLYLPEDDNWPNTIWIVDEKSHTDNRICIGVNMNDFAKKFFPSYPDSGNIYCLVDKNGKILLKKSVPTGASRKKEESGSCSGGSRVLCAGGRRSAL